MWNNAEWQLPELQLEENSELWAAESLSARAKEHPQARRLWARFLGFCEKTAQKLNADWTCSVEICLQTYEDTGVVKLHLSMVMSREEEFRFTNPWQLLEFEKRTAIYSPKITNDDSARLSMKKGRRSMFAQASYYLQFPKKGMVFQNGKKKPFIDYQVKPRWVTDYLQASSNIFQKRARRLKKKKESPKPPVDTDATAR